MQFIERHFDHYIIKFGQGNRISRNHLALSLHQAVSTTIIDFESSIQYKIANLRWVPATSITSHRPVLLIIGYLSLTIMNLYRIYTSCALQQDLSLQQ